MPENKIYQEFTLTNVGLSQNLPIADIFNLYTVDGAGVTLTGDVNFTTSDTPTKGVIFKILWNGNGLVKGANNITIFGVALTAQQALGKVAIEANYNGSAFVTQTHASFDGAGIVGTSNLADGAVSTAKIAANAVTAAQIADATITAEQVADGAIGTAEIAANAVTAAKLDSQAASFSITIPISFASAAVGGNFAIYVEHNINIHTVKSSVIEPIAGTDAANIEVFLQGNSLGTLAIPLSSGQGTANSLTTTGTTNATYSGTPLQIRLQPNKATAGGVVLLTLLCTRI